MLNSLQTSAEVLERKRDQVRQHADLALLEQKRRDENHHREPKAKLKNMQYFLECSGICSVSYNCRVHIIIIIHFPHNTLISWSDTYNYSYANVVPILGG